MLSITQDMGGGGAERALVTLLPALQSKGFQCEVAALWPPYTTAQELESAGVPVHRLDISSSWNLPQGIGRVARVIRGGNYDIVHAHVFFAGFYTALSRLAATGPRRVVTFHNLGYDSYPANTLRRKLLKTTNRFLMRNCMDAYVAVSSAVAEHYSRHLSLKDVTVIPNAVCASEAPRLTEQQRRELRRSYGAHDADFVWLMAGRFVHEKGHRYLRQALEVLRERGITPRVWIFGNGPLFDQTKSAFAASETQTQVMIAPALPHDELLKVMQAADAFVMASTHEGFPLAPAEAMLLSLPVVATCVGGLPELIKDNFSGILVLPGNPQALADGLMRMMSDTGMRRRLGEAGCERVLSTFSLEALVPQWQAFYQNLLGATSS